MENKVKSNNSVIRLEYKDIVRIKELLGEDKIIAAIKHCRSNGHHFVDGVKQFAEGSNQKRVSLKAAKHAIDVFRGRPPQGTPEAIIAPALVIKSIRVETLEGEFEVSRIGRLWSLTFHRLSEIWELK